MDPALRQRIYHFIESKNLRKTTQRDAIIEAAFSTKEHYTAEELLLMARRLDPAVSRATVYRTLPLLVESGALKEMDFGKDYKFYDPNYVDHPNHNHLICTDCSKIVEFDFTPEKKTVRIEAKCDLLAREGICLIRKVQTQF